MTLTYSQRSPGAKLLSVRRQLIIGGPNQGKTHSATTWDKRVAVIAMPDELGDTTLDDRDDVVVFRPDPLDPSKPIDWKGIIDGTKLHVASVIAGKHGAFQTVFIDGLHKLYACYFGLVTGGKRADEIEGRRAYPAAKQLFFNDLRIWLRSSIPQLVCTCWVGRDKEEDGEKAPSFIYPALPGQAGQDVVGEFCVVVEAFREGTGKTAKFWWKTKPDGKTHGVGIKLEPAVVDQIPDRVPQDWQVLKKYLLPGERT